MTRKYFLFCFYVLVSVLCLGKPSVAYPAGSLNGGGATPAVDAIFQTDSITPLKIGDKIPDELWEMTFPMVSGGSDEVHHLKLGDYRDKLIILDFWATWCAPCISSLHKLDTLQQEFADDLLVLPTSYEAQDKVRKFFTDKGWSLPTAFGETHLKKYFPHRSIPHQVWIKGGEVMAITGPEYASRETLQSLLSGDSVRMDVKNEVAFDASKPLFHNGNGGDGSVMLYQSVISGRIPARVSGVSRAKPNQIMAYNQSAEQLFRMALQDSISEMISDRYLLWEVSDDVKKQMSFEHVLDKGRGAIEDWADKNLFTYNLVLPPGADREDVNKQMFGDLNRFFGQYLEVNVSIEKKRMKCLALVTLPGFSGVATKGGKPFTRHDSTEAVLQNQPIAKLIEWVNHAHRSYPLPITDETGITGTVDLKLNAVFSDLASLRKELNKRNLDLQEKVVPVKMIVIRSINKKDKE